MDPHHLAEERSLAFHALVAAQLDGDPAVLERARLRVDGWIAAGTPHPHYARAWAAVLSLPVAVIKERLVDPGSEGRALRQVTPFAGVLSPGERWRVWREVRAKHMAG